MNNILKSGSLIAVFILPFLFSGTSAGAQSRDSDSTWVSFDRQQKEARVILDNIKNTQKSRIKARHIFLWDVTLSMYGKQYTTQSGFDDAETSKNIYDKVQDDIIKQITYIQENDATAEIVILPYQFSTTPIDSIRVSAKDAIDLIERIPSLKEKYYYNAKEAADYNYNHGCYYLGADQKKHYSGTDILSSLRWAVDNCCIEDKENYVYLLTDGDQNFNFDRDSLLNYLRTDYKKFSKLKNNHGYYFLVSADSASDKGTKELRNTLLEEGDEIGMRPIDSENGVRFPTVISFMPQKIINLADDQDVKEIDFSYAIQSGPALPENCPFTFIVRENPYDLSLGEVSEARENGYSVKFDYNYNKANRALHPKDRLHFVVDVAVKEGHDGEIELLTPQIVITLKNDAESTVKFNWK